VKLKASRRRPARRIAGLVAGTVVAALIAVPAASAATYTVQNATDTTPGTACSTFPSNCSLRQLIEHENGLSSTPSPPDVIVVPAGSYSVNSVLTITRSVSIQGAGARTTTVAENTSDRVFAVEPPAGAVPGPVPTVSISGLAIWFGVATASNGSFGGNVLNEGNLKLNEDYIQGGNAQSGAGVSNEGGTLTVTHSLISGNTANSGGADSGGVQNFGPNPATGTPGVLEVDNSTISHNTANLGGGIFSWCGGTNGACSSSGATNSTTIVNSTIAYNDGGTRSATGGGLLVGEGTISVENSIVAFNTVDTPSAGTASNCSSGVASLGHNLETGTDCGFTMPGDIQSTDPQFTSISQQDNGGNTDSFALALTSPAIDAIPAGAPSCGGTDQRDLSRPQGTACDIGAFELLQPVEGQQFTAAMATAHAAISTNQPITINWGDGTSSAGTTDGQSALIGTHTYTEEGVYTVTVRWTDDGGSESSSSDVRVVDAPLTSVGASVTGQAGVAFTGTVATYTDADPAGTSSDYSATINWGDGSVSAGTIAPSGSGFQVTGTHTYSSGGLFATTISIADAGGAKTVAQGTATIASAPSPVITGGPVVGSTTAGFSGAVNPDGLPTNAFFQYGLDPKYSPGGGPLVYTQSTPVQSVGSDFSSHVVSASVTGLAPNAVYHVRLAATNSAGTTFGPDVTFTTGKLPAPGSPALGKTFNVSLVSGLVLVKINGQFIPLTELTQIPKNTVINALHGTLSLTSAAGGPSPARDAAAKKKPKKTKTQKGTFGGAIFKISQTTAGSGKGLVTLAIVENAFKGAPSYATCKAHKAIEATAASSRTLQLLHASAKGKFRTKGKYSAATVLGTKWTVADRCDGTLTHDITDSVLVNDFVHHKTIVLHAGQSYLARAPKHK
jgi:hypothetical protein